MWTNMNRLDLVLPFLELGDFKLRGDKLVPLPALVILVGQRPYTPALQGHSVGCLEPLSVGVLQLQHRDARTIAIVTCVKL